MSERFRGGMPPRRGTRGRDYNNPHQANRSSKPSLEGVQQHARGSYHGRGRGRHDGQQKFNFKGVQGLCKDDFDPIKVAEILSRDIEDFKSLLQGRPGKEFLLLIMRLVKKIVQCPFTKMKITVFGAYLNITFIEYLLFFMLTELKPNDIQYCEEFLTLLCLLFEEAISLSPHMSESLIPVLECSITVVKKMPNCEELNTRLHTQKMNLEAFITNKFSSTSKTPQVDKNHMQVVVPDDFRTISLYPQPVDFSSSGFVRANIVEGSYEDVNHYLDVQFRLLREDFIDPLREGINTYKESCSFKNKVKNFNVRIYKNVQFIGINADPKQASKLSVCVRLEEKSCKNIRWENSKRLLYGSLLLFSKNDFVTFFLGTVHEKDLKEIKNGNFKIILVNMSLSEINLNDTYTMAECSVFFEPYYHVLNCLQEMSLHNSLPMQKYLLVQDPVPAIPSYIKGWNIEHMKYLSSHFNQSQFTAYEAALSNDFVVIQGPPGTGKTYLALKIVSTLLKLHDELINAPIVVVCYTNHALDQFLEGVAKETNAIVRVGGQCKNENIKKFNLNNLFRTKSSNKTREKIRKVYEIQSTIASVNSQLGLLKVEGVLNLPRFCKFESLSTCTDFPDVFIDMNTKHFTQWLFPQVVSDLLETVKKLLEGSSIKAIIKDNKAAINENDSDTDEIGDEENELRLASMMEDSIQFDEQLSVDFSNVFLLTLDGLTKIENIVENKIFEFNNTNAKKDSPELMACLSIIQNSANVRNIVKRMLKPSGPLIDSEMFSQLVGNIYNLNFGHKCMIYNYLLNMIKETLQGSLINLHEKHSAAISELRETEMFEQYNFIKNYKPKIIGFTTTGAARSRKLLEAIQAKVVIAEEAAECLEGHIVVSLTESVKHVILIGDHKQLRPSPATYKLAKKMGLEISLFERMIKNGLNCYTLSIQHRMRPEMSALLVPTIYEDLKNSSSVHHYPNILGMKKNLFFIDHTHTEDQADEFSSHSNSFEVEFIIALCRYLLRQGYSSDQITILTTYSSQLLHLMKMKKRIPSLMNVRITVVDNFQGEENDIILLSLVRSNKEANVGFLATDNRICVAMSRAKWGFYIIGNMSNLSAASQTWSHMNETLLCQGSIGKELPLRCQVHGKETLMSCAGDFIKVPEGGCDELCRRVMPCSHHCKNLCHPDDLEHIHVQCFDPCSRSPCGYPDHKCPFLCKDKCEPCIIPVRKLLPCGHTGTIPCHLDPKDYRCLIPVNDMKPICGHPVTRDCFKSIDRVACPKPCNTRLNCGHSCTKMCHAEKDPHHLEYQCMKDCSRISLNCRNNHPCLRRCHEQCTDCLVLVEYTLKCGHQHKLACSVDLNAYQCTRNCRSVRPCSHKCKLKCFEACGPCKEMVKKVIIECGHEIKAECSSVPTKIMCKSAKCSKTLPCGHLCALPCRMDCTKVQCKTLVPAAAKLICGHSASLPCFMTHTNVDPSSDAYLRYCKEPCNGKLPCDHRCKGTCGLCMQGRIHVPCDEQCGNVLVCGHSCEIPCREECPPCTKTCQFKCEHSQCKEMCGRPCISCKEKCTYQCPHKKCTKLCGDRCDRDPCYEPCKKKLKCGHPCVGFCGEPCPPPCRVCPETADTLKTILFGNEDEDDARFVLLEDCGHVVESSGLEQWLTAASNDGNQEISLSLCPWCKSSIMKTKRFMNKAIQFMEDCVRIKTKIFGDQEKNKIDQNIQYQKLQNLFKKVDSYFKSPNQLVLKLQKSFENIIHLLQEKFVLVKGKNQKNYLKQMATSELKLCEFLILALDQITSGLIKYPLSNSSYSEKIALRIDLLLYHLSKRRQKVNSFEMSQFDNEISRLYYLLEINNMQVFKNPYLDEINRILFSITEFTQDKSLHIKQLLKTLPKTFYQEVTQEERTMINHAMSKDYLSSKQGHWFKCSNGHPYTITECGGAMQKATCPECKEVIGGQNHTLVTTSRLASEIDGAQYPAWSERNNMDNFRF